MSKLFLPLGRYNQVILVFQDFLTQILSGFHTHHLKWRILGRFSLVKRRKMHWMKFGLPLALLPRSQTESRLGFSEMPALDTEEGSASIQDFFETLHWPQKNKYKAYVTHEMLIQTQYGSRSATWNPQFCSLFCSETEISALGTSYCPSWKISYLVFPLAPRTCRFSLRLSSLCGHQSASPALSVGRERVSESAEPSLAWSMNVLSKYLLNVSDCPDTVFPSSPADSGSAKTYLGLAVAPRRLSRHWIQQVAFISISLCSQCQVAVDQAVQQGDPI